MLHIHEALGSTLDIKTVIAFQYSLGLDRLIEPNAHRAIDCLQ